jgi:O-antigen ligase
MPNQLSTEYKSYSAIWFGMLIIILALAAPWFNLTVSNHDFVKSYFAFIGCGFVMILSLLTNINMETPNTNIHINLLKIPLIFLFVFGTLSILWSANYDLTINKLLLWIVALFSFVIGSNFSLTKKSLLLFSWGLMFAAGLISCIGILQYLFDPLSLTQAVSPASTFGNKNLASQPLILILPLSLYLLFSKDTENSKVWLLSIITSFIFIYIFYASSRAIWIALFIQLLMILIYLFIYKIKKNSWIDWNTNKRNACLFGLTIFLIFINLSSEGFNNFLSVTLDNLESISESANDGGSSRYRIWETAINMFLSSPFVGSGLGTFSHNLANEGFALWDINNSFRAHNDLLELSVELGLIGLVLFCLVMVSILRAIILVLTKSKTNINLLFFLILVSLSGSFINLQFSFPYQVTLPIILFCAYCGLISKKLDEIQPPIKLFTLKISVFYKKIILFSLSIVILFIFYFSYFSWIKTYDLLDRINISGTFNDIEIVEDRIYHKDMQYMLYSLGGNYFNKGDYKKSNAIDDQFLKFWPNHLDVVFRSAYAKHKLGQNKISLELSNKLETLEPQGLYNSFIVKMFLYSSLEKVDKFEKIYLELLSQPEPYLKLNDDSYRYLIFFSLKSKNLFKYTPDLYKKYKKYHGYSCEVVNNMAIYYFNLEQFAQSSEFVNEALNNYSDCLNPTLIMLLKDKNLINIDN